LLLFPNFDLVLHRSCSDDQEACANCDQDFGQGDLKLRTCE